MHDVQVVDDGAIVELKPISAQAKKHFRATLNQDRPDGTVVLDSWEVRPVLEECVAKGFQITGADGLLD